MLLHNCEFAPDPVDDTVNGIVDLLADNNAVAPFLGVTATPNGAMVPVRAEMPVKPVASVSQTEAPTCPKCGSVMILRTAKSGANAGSQFWGCSKYPTCRTMLPYKA